MGIGEEIVMQGALERISYASFAMIRTLQSLPQ